MVVDGARNTLAVTKADEATNEAGNPALDSSFNANGTADPANALIDEHKEAKVASVGNSLLDDELDAVEESNKRKSLQG